ncbi:unnamed protein product [Brassica rapa subsp. trilocularis]
MDVTIAEAKRVASQYQEEALNFCMRCPRNSVHKILKGFNVQHFFSLLNNVPLKWIVIFIVKKDSKVSK